MKEAITNPMDVTSSVFSHWSGDGGLAFPSFVQEETPQRERMDCWSGKGVTLSSICSGRCTMQRKGGSHQGFLLLSVGGTQEGRARQRTSELCLPSYCDTKGIGNPSGTVHTLPHPHHPAKLHIHASSGKSQRFFLQTKHVRHYMCRN